MPLTPYHADLERLYTRYNRRRFVSPDPLELVHACDDPADQEVTGLVAACLAYGRVEQILRSARWALERLGERPARTVRDATPGELASSMAGFRHRFQTDREMTALLLGIRRVLRRRGCLERCYVRAARGEREEAGLAGLCGLVEAIDPQARCGHLLARPTGGSACKRLWLFLRWMIRRDAVDPGPWTSGDAAALLVPLDTHMHAICRTLGATDRKTASLAAARQVTAAFRRVCPEDPARYDFALTRWGIRPELDRESLLRRLVLQ